MAEVDDETVRTDKDLTDPADCVSAPVGLPCVTWTCWARSLRVPHPLDEMQCPSRHSLGPSLGSYLAAVRSGATPGNDTLTTVPERSGAFPSSPSSPCSPAQCRRGATSARISVGSGEVAQMRPPCSSTIPRAMASPRPALELSSPEAAVVAKLATCLLRETSPR